MAKKQRSRDAGAPAPTSGRQRRSSHPRGTFATFLDGLLAFDFFYSQHGQGDFTTYKESLARRLGITPRHLSRFLSGQALPELRFLRKLRSEFPQAPPEGWVPKLGWDSVANQIALLPEGSVISLFVGHLSADEIAAIPPNVMMQIAKSIGHNQFHYVWVVGPISASLHTDELLPERIAERLRLRVLSAWLDQNPEATRGQSIEKQISQRVTVFQTKASEETAHFWARLPQYLVISNLLASPQQDFPQYQFSATYDRGSVPYPENMKGGPERLPEPVTTQGWSYLVQRDDECLRRMFEKMDQGGFFINPERQNQGFPRPAAGHSSTQSS